MQKVVDAAVRQVKGYSELSIEKLGIDELPEKLRIVARLRWDNPEAESERTFEELMDGELSKSGYWTSFKENRSISTYV